MDVNPTEVQRYLRGADYPAATEDLVTLAASHDAPSEVIDALESLDDEEFSSPAALMRALGHEDDDDEDDE